MMLTTDFYYVGIYPSVSHVPSVFTRKQHWHPPLIHMLKTPISQSSVFHGVEHKIYLFNSGVSFYFGMHHVCLGS